ncbi:MAG: hypothetical protein JSS86_06400 [Cyanobacteria bacterium SZAS LIN-2]|nr:hypothetical protein [Cyanobacteria bacterium SZAS LIN-2]
MCAAARESGRDPAKDSGLKNIYSYMTAQAVSPSLIHQLEIGAGETLIGIYFNSPDHLIAFTDKAFYWLRSEREVICHYSSILRTKLPDDEQDVRDERAIEIALKNGDFLFLPIFNDTDGVEDIYCLAEMLDVWIDASINIRALEDMIAKLNAAFEEYKVKPSSWNVPLPVEYFESVIGYLYQCLDNCVSGKPFLNISNDQYLNINQPRTWQLIAQILLAPKTFDPTKSSKHADHHNEE